MASHLAGLGCKDCEQKGPNLDPLSLITTLMLFFFGGAPPSPPHFLPPMLQLQVVKSWAGALGMCQWVYPY